jgi:hypothetical protein
MAGITLETAEAKLQTWLDAEDALATSQSYTIANANGTRTLTRADLGQIRDNIKFWDRKVQDLSRGGGKRVRQVVPVSN